MVCRAANQGTGVPCRRARGICGGVFALGLALVLLAAGPVHRALRREAEVEALTWLKAQADAIRPFVLQAESHGLDASVRLPRGTSAESDGGLRQHPCRHSQLWLVSAIEGEPGLIVPVSAGAAGDEPLRDFGILQAGISEARGSATRPLAFVDGPDGRLAVAYLRLAHTGYGVAMAVCAEQLYAGVRARSLTYAVTAVALLALACLGLYALIVQPTAGSGTDRRSAG